MRQLTDPSRRSFDRLDGYKHDHGEADELYLTINNSTLKPTRPISDDDEDPEEQA